MKWEEIVGCMGEEVRKEEKKEEGRNKEKCLYPTEELQLHVKYAIMPLCPYFIND